MSAVNFDNVLGQLADAGLIVDSSRLTFDARIQRWKVNGENAEKRGWTKLREWTSKGGHCYIVGAFGIWRGNDEGYTRISLPKRGDPDRPALTPDDMLAIREAQKAAAASLAAERKAEAKTAGRWAALVWAQAKPCAEHEYTTRKQITPANLRVLESLEGLEIPGLDSSNHYRLAAAVGALVVPMHDAQANVCGVQFIYPRGHERAKKIERDKEFWPAGMAMAGTFGILGAVSRTGVLLVTEGYATAASLHQATGQAVVYAFSANNLLKAGKLVRKIYPRVRLLFCADDDYLTTGNPGVTAASEATAALENSAWIKPDFADEAGADRRAGKKLTDYNDLAVLTGLPLLLANQVNAKLDVLKWRDAATGRADANQGQGEGGNVDEQGRRRAPSVMTLDALVRRFYPLDDGTGKFVFDTWTNKVAHRDQMFALMPAGTKADELKRHPLYISRGACFIDQVGFDPAGNDPDVLLNTWRGWPMKPVPGSCERLLELIRYLCSADPKADEVYEWLLCWMAYPLQNPGAKMDSAVIMHGPQGTGKTTIFQSLAKIYGDYATVLNQRGIEDKFNSDWSDSKLFILAEEVATRAEMWHIKNELKQLVTDPYIRVNPKNIAAYRQRNHLNIAYLSNEDQPLPIENDDRRHCVIYTPPKLPPAFYDEVFRELDNGGVAAFYAYLLALDLSNFNPHKIPPETEAKRNLIEQSSSTEIRFINDWLLGDLNLPICPCFSADLYDAYARWCRRNGDFKARNSSAFFGTIHHLPGWKKERQRVYESLESTKPSKSTPMIFPPKHRVEQDGHAMKRGTSITVYLTECRLKFAEASNVASDSHLKIVK